MNSNRSYSPETPNLGQIRRFLEPCDLENSRVTFKNNRTHLLCYFKLCAAFRSHWCIQTGVTVRKRPIWVKFDAFWSRVTLKFWRMTLKNNRAPLLSIIKLYASFHHHTLIPTGPFAWTLLWSLVIIPENFMMIRWWEHSQKSVTDRQTDRRTDGQTENTICRAAWSQLKIQIRNWNGCQTLNELVTWLDLLQSSWAKSFQSTN